MQNSAQKTNTILLSFNKMVVDLPTPSNISTLWNFGSLAGFFLAIQILTGTFLAMYYTSDIKTAFESINQIMRNVNYGWTMRLIHSTSASFMFISLLIHMGRNLYFMMFMKPNHVWESGVSIFILTMATAFFGYILPWGQMSFWGATVITNLFSAIPMIGKSLVEWIWGGFAVSGPTLSRFFAIHFFLPFIIMLFMVIHLVMIHTTGSSNPLKSKSNFDKTTFHTYFTLKDSTGFIIAAIIMIMMTYLLPYILMEPDNFIPANPMMTPPHIQPEWYFLFVYTILRSIPNKLGGVIALLSSLLILFIIKFLYTEKKSLKTKILINKMMFWMLMNTFIMLTWIGMCPVEAPFELIGKISSFLYFILFLITPFAMKSK